MNVTVDLTENPSVRVTDERIEAGPPDLIAFDVEGAVTMTKALLGEFAGQSLKPARITISVDDSSTVEVDLQDESSLRLETIDVRVEMPDADDLASGAETIEAALGGADESTHPPPGAIAFSVDGTIRNVPTEAFDRIADGSPTLESITFAVDDAIRSDGGSDDDALASFTLLGYGIIIRRNGVIDVGTCGIATDAGPL